MAVVVSCKYSIIQNEIELEMFNFEEEGKLENPKKNSLSKARRNLITYMTKHQPLEY